MPLREYDVYVTADATITTTTEKVAITTPGITTANSGEKVVIDAEVNVTSGTGTTSLTLSCRRGTAITGTLVGEAPAQTTTAGNAVTLSGLWEDVPGDVASQQYVVTVTQTGATANGTINNAGGTIAVGSG